MVDTRPSEKTPKQTFDELAELVKSYARQETTGPLKHLGKWIAVGLASMVCWAIGSVFLAFGLLRLLQSEVGAFDDDWSWVPYLLTFAFLAVIVGLCGWAIKRTVSDGRSA